MNKTLKETSHLKFKDVEDRPKVYQIISKKQDELLAVVEWNLKWKRWVWKPVFYDRIFDEENTRDIAEFLKELSEGKYG